MWPSYAPLPPQYSPSPPMPCSSHWPACICKSPRDEAAWRRRSRGRKRARRSGETRVYPELDNEVVLPLRLLEPTPNGKMKLFCHSDLSSCGRRPKRAGCGRVRSRNIRFGHVLIVVRQGRQRRDAAAAGEEYLGRCAARRLYLYSGKLALAAMYFRRDRVTGRSFVAGAPPLAPV
jgi:hypothetical protein